MKLSALPVSPDTFSATSRARRKGESVRRLGILLAATIPGLLPLGGVAVAETIISRCPTENLIGGEYWGHPRNRSSLRHQRPRQNYQLGRTRYHVSTHDQTLDLQRNALQKVRL